MANFISTTDVSMSIVPEDVFGTTPTAGPAVRYELPTKNGQAPLAMKADKIASDTRRPGRAANGSTRGMASADGSFDIRFQSAPVIDRLMESALSGRFDQDGKLKGSDQDLYFTTLATLKAGAAGAAMVQATKGCAVTNMTVTASVNAALDSSFTIIGATRDNLDTDNALTVTEMPASAVEMDGGDVHNCKVAGTQLSWSKVELAVGSAKTPRGVLGQRDAVDLANSGTRATTITLTAYRESFEINDLVDGSKQEVVVEFTVDGKGYRVTLPAAQADFPNDDVDGDNLIVVIEFTAAYDETQGTDIIIEKLS
ncbi:phage tail tube protein [Sphingomonas oryzagri]